MTRTIIKDPILARYYDSIKQWVHPDHPFLAAQYSPASNAPAVDYTGFITECLLNNNRAAIEELWSYISYNDIASHRMLKTAMAVDYPDWFQIPKAVKAELKAINMLVARCSLCSSEVITRIACQLAASAIANQQLIIPPQHMDLLYRMTRSEMTSDSYLGFQHGINKGTEIALTTALSPLGDALPCADIIKSVPPMSRLVIHDFVTRTRARSLLYDLYYGDRMYGCGSEHNRIFIDRLEIFTAPNDVDKIPSMVTKEKIFCFLTDKSISFKKTATRKALLEQISSDKSLTCDLFLTHAPDSCILAPQWEKSVKSWSERVKIIEAVGGGVLKMLAQQSLYYK